MDSHSWSLRDETLLLLRRWHWLAAACLAGALAGWLLSLALPAQYEAVSGLSVRFNSDAIYLTPDDYKNWQLAELADLAVSDRTLSLTLDALRAEDPGLGWTLPDLRAAVTPRWRNAGVWQLVVHSGDPDQASRVATAWRSVILDETAEALRHARSFNRLDRQLNGQVRAIGLLQLDLQMLAAVERDLGAWLEAPEAAGGAARAAVLSARLSNLRTLTLALPLPLPAKDSGLSEAALWVRAARLVVADETAYLEDVLGDLQSAADALEEDWLRELDASRGLSAYLLVEPARSSTVEVSRAYASGPLALAGGVIGALLLPVFRLLRIVRRGEREANR